MSQDILPAWFIEPIMALAVAFATNTNMTRRPFAVTVGEDAGLRIGLAPGEAVRIHTAAGYITVTSEQKEPTP